MNNKIKNILILLCLTAFNAVGQSNFSFKSHPEFSSFHTGEFNKFSSDFLTLSLFTKPLFDTGFETKEKRILKPVEAFKYEAFFCRIEQQMCNRFDVWIKIRVGDEYNYPGR